MAYGGFFEQHRNAKKEEKAAVVKQEPNKKLLVNVSRFFVYSKVEVELLRKLSQEFSGRLEFTVEETEDNVFLVEAYGISEQLLAMVSYLITTRRDKAHFLEHCRTEA